MRIYEIGKKCIQFSDTFTGELEVEAISSKASYQDIVDALNNAIESARIEAEKARQVKVDDDTWLDSKDLKRLFRASRWDRERMLSSQEVRIKKFGETVNCKKYYNKKDVINYYNKLTKNKGE